MKNLQAEFEGGLAALVVILKDKITGDQVLVYMRPLSKEDNGETDALFTVELLEKLETDTQPSATGSRPCEVAFDFMPDGIKGRFLFQSLFNSDCKKLSVPDGFISGRPIAHTLQRKERLLEAEYRTVDPDDRDVILKHLVVGVGPNVTGVGSNNKKFDDRFEILDFLSGPLNYV